MRWSFFVHAIASVALIACNAVDANGEEPKKAGKVAAFELTIESSPVKTGKDGAFAVVITPSKGYKWNKDFPASFKVNSADSPVATLAKKEFTRDAFKTKGKRTALSVPFRGGDVGSSKVAGKARFSVCNEKTCLLLNEDVQVELTVN